MVGFVEAVQELSRVPLAEFVAERKRLAGKLKQGGDAAAAKVLLARKRPTISAWVVNQLFWHARDAFDAMLATAERLRKGDLKASGEHREAIGKLRQRAATIVRDAGSNPNEATLRRVTTTLSALAAVGSFEPDPPGALAEDRDPPGFEAIGIPSEPATSAEGKKHEAKKHDGHKRDGHKHDGHKHDGHKQDGHKHDGGHVKDELAAARAKQAAAKKAREQEEAERRSEEIAEKKRAEAEKKRLATERHRLELALRSAKADRVERERELRQAEKQVTVAQKALDHAQEIVDDIESELAKLDDAN